MSAADRHLRVAVAGAAGYVGGELLRLLAGHPRVASLAAFSRSRGGAPLGDVHPALAHLPLGAQPLAEGGPERAAEGADVLFLALPHGDSQRAIDAVLAREPRLVVDLAADFRIRDMALYRQHYGEHAAPSLAPTFVYGLADVLGTRLAGARRIAAPGCFATATLLALHAFAAAGLLDTPPVAVALTGSTGAGASPRPTTHHPVRAHNLFAYAPGGHRHEAEIAEQLREASGRSEERCTLLPHSAPLVRGIHVTATFRPVTTCPDPLALLGEAWAGRRFVHVVDTPPELAAVTGTNHARIHAVARDGGREVVVWCVIDNLVKGAAGQAIQAMNLALEHQEDEGLSFPGLYPC